MQIYPETLSRQEILSKKEYFQLRRELVCSLLIEYRITDGHILKPSEAISIADDTFMRLGCYFLENPEK